MKIHPAVEEEFYVGPWPYSKDPWPSVDAMSREEATWAMRIAQAKVHHMLIEIGAGVMQTKIGKLFCLPREPS